ncbi:MAG: hypothetical protein JNN00_09230 [Chitinophagaceae bacterium]|nr:hypothetical protein [Chitinophagaceae bacterium]
MKIKLAFIALSFITLTTYGQNVGINTTTPEAALDINGDIIIRPADLIVADGTTLAMDVNTVKFSYYRINGPTANFVIAGITSGIDGRVLTLFNRSGFAMQINNEDVTAAVGDMVVTGTGADIIIPNKGVVNLQYDAAGQQWIVKSSSKGAGSGSGNWDINGNDIFNINGGNVGIGTSNPASKLTIQTPLNSTGWRHSAGSDEIIVQEAVGAVSASVGTVTNNAFRIMANSEGKLHVYPGGEVIVGTNTTPSFGKFSVETDNNSYGVSHISTQGNILATRIGGTSAGVGTFSATDMRIFCNGQSNMFFASVNGNVGIGVNMNDPQFQLDVANRIRIRSAVGSTAGVWFNNPGNSAAIAFMGVLDNSTAGIYGSGAGWGLTMNTNNGNVGIGTTFPLQKLDVNGNALISGNVGIGTVNPSYKLSVNGTIQSKEVIVETGWADYVFEKNYKLLSLSEVEKFIQQNKHLPNIPSAKEIEENGLQLGNVQKRMMEKIEELTLYVIELRKEIELLKNKK